MIVAETPGGLQFVTQPAHAALAGQFADNWGGDPIQPPDPPVAMSIAAYAHDTGWGAYDRHPRLGDDGAPIDFRGMPADPWIDLYEEGIDAVVEMDSYAGLLVSMHGAGLRRRRYGLSPSWPETPPAFEGFVDREETRQARLANALREEGRLDESDVDLLATLHESGAPPAGVERRLWDGYTLLQAWDALSLSFCVTSSPPGYGEVGPVPAGDAGTVSLSIEAADGRFRIDPYPFEASPLVVSVPVRTVRTESFEDEADLVRAYYRADRELREFRIVSG
ncbi:MAG: DUF3891 family protein [Halobacteriales archaeon]